MTLRQTPLTCPGHTRPVVDLGFSAITNHGYFLISACKDGKPMLRQGDTGDWIGTFDGHKGAVWGVSLNADATKAATGGADFTAKLWDASKGDELHTFTHKHIVKSVSFSPNGEHLLTGSNEKILRVFNLEKLGAEPQVFSGHESHIKRVLWSSDGKTIFSAADDKTVRLWDVSNQCEIKHIDLHDAPTDLELTSDGNTLLVTHGRKISFWDAHKLEKLKEFEIPTPVFSGSLHPDKRVFVCGGDDFKMYKFDFETGLEIESFKGHFGPVHCIRFSPDGELYASGSEDGTVRLWQTVIGKTYGLWKYVSPDETTNNSEATTKVED